MENNKGDVVVMNSSNYSKFPAILKDKIKRGEIEFPLHTKFFYEPIRAYRMVERESEDFTKVSRKDFKSYAELRKKKIRGKNIDTTKPEYYRVSLYRKQEMLENILKLPKPNKKIARGFIYQEGGPQLTNEVTEHITWWLYEDVDLKEFELLIEEGEKDE